VADAGLGGAAGAGIGGMSGAGGAGSLAFRSCHTDADCIFEVDGGGFPLQLACFINGPITDCARAPEGICVGVSMSNCLTHPNVCDCLNIAVDTSCAAFQGTSCGRSGFSCWGCFTKPDAGSPGGASDANGG